MKFLKHINSFDTYRAIWVSFLLILGFYIGFKNDSYGIAFAFGAGVMFAFFPNIEGNNTERFWGMVLGINWAHMNLLLYLYLPDDKPYMKIASLLFMAFVSSMLAVFGNRGVMVSFGGLFALVMGLSIDNLLIIKTQALTFTIAGSVSYLVLAMISHWFFQKKNIDLLLSDQLECLSKYLQGSHISNFEPNSNNNQLDLLQIMGKTNELQELIRTMIMNDRKYDPHKNSKIRQLEIFKELIDIYELAIASNQELVTEQSFAANNQWLVDKFKGFSSNYIQCINELEANLRYGYTLPNLENLKASFLECESSIKLYVHKVGASNAREGALFLRNLLDYFSVQKDRLENIIHIIENPGLEVKQESYTSFLAGQSYSIKTILDNLHRQSTTFRFSMRLLAALILSVLVGIYTNPIYTNWIVVTVIVIMRPSYGLTKNRALNRLGGTIMGVGLLFLINFLNVDVFWIGIFAGLSIVLGFSFINRNYALASAFITFSILSLFLLNKFDVSDLIKNRLLFSAYAVLIVIMVNYLVFPVWEKHNFSNYLKRVLKANLQYFNSVNSIYTQKSKIELSYRLIRKKAFTENGNLAAAFERIKNEPKSRQNEANNFYALVLLNHTFLSSTATFSTFIQHHLTTETSDAFDEIKAYIKENIEIAISIIEQKKYKEKINDSDIDDAFRVLEKKYLQLNQQRDKELLDGIRTMNPLMRAKLLEGKIVIEQLKAFRQVSENIKYYVQQIV